MQTRHVLIALATCAALVLLAPSDDSRAQPQPAPPAPPLPPPATVEVAPASVADIATVQWVPGTVLSRADAQIASEQSGRVLEIAEVGERVAQGGVIARLDAEALVLAEREAEAALARIAAQLAFQERQLGRLAALKRRSSVAENQLDEARNQRDLLQHDQARAEVALAAARRQLREATIRAPFEGLVAERRAQRGEYLAAGAVLVRLVDTTHTEVSARAPVGIGIALQAGAMVALRDHYLSAEIMGINLTYYRILAFGISSFYAGVGGALMAHYTSFVSAEAFDLLLSINFLAMVIIGGLGSVMGSLMGTVFILFLPEFMQGVVRIVQGLGIGQSAAFTEGLAYLKEMAIGLAIVLFLIFEPEGLAARWRKIKAYWKLYPFSY